MSKHVNPVVHGDFGVVPAQSSGSSVTLVLQQAWLDVQAEANEVKQKALLCGKLYEAFVSSCSQFDSVPFKRSFGDGGTLTSVVCRTFCRESRNALRDQFPSNAAAIAKLLHSDEYLVLLSIMATLCDPNFYGGAIDQAAYDNVLRIVVLHNVPSMLMALHSAFLDLANLPHVEDESTVSSEIIMAEQKALSLLLLLLSDPGAVKDIQNSGGCDGIARTFKVLVNSPLTASASITALALDALQTLLNEENKSVMFPTESCIDKVFEHVTATFFFKKLESTDSEALDAQRLNSVVHTLSTLQLLLQRIPMKRESVRPLRDVDFMVVTRSLHQLEGTMASYKRITQRLFELLAWFATMPFETASEKVEPKKKSFSVFKAVASVFQKETSQQESADASKKATQITNPNVMGAIVEFIVSSKLFDAQLAAFNSLILTLKKYGVDADYVRDIGSLFSGADRLSEKQLVTILDTVEGLATEVEEQTPVRMSPDSIVQCTTVLVGKLRSLKLSYSAASRVITYLTTLAANGATSPVIINSGCVSLCVLWMRSLCDESTTGPAPPPFTNEGRSSDVGTQIVFLWKLLLRIPGTMDICLQTNAAETLVACLHSGVAQEPTLESMVSVQAKGVASYARDMLICLVSSSPPQISSLVDTLLRESDKHGLSTTVSHLLVAMASIIYGAKCFEEAIRQNALEICLSLLQSIGTSARIASDAHILGTCISLLVPFVRFSEAGRMLSVSVPKQLRGDLVMCQLMVDLCTGWCCEMDNITALLQFFDTNTIVPAPTSSVLAFEDSEKAKEKQILFRRSRCRLIGSSFQVPCDPASHEFLPPLMVLCRWYNDLQSGKLRPPNPPSLQDLREVIAHLCHNTATIPKEEEFTKFVAEHGMYDLPVADIYPIRQRFLAERKTSLPIWKNVLMRPASDYHFKHFIEFQGSGGAFGAVEPPEGRAWPPPTGYTVSMWVHWHQGPLPAESPITTPQSSFSSFVDGSFATTSAVEKVGHLQLFSFSWSSTDSSTPPTRVSLAIDTVQKMTVFTQRVGDQESCVPYPYIPPDQWNHITLVHQRNKLFASEAIMYVNAAVGKKQNVTYPLHTVTGVAAQVTNLAGVRNFNCAVGFDPKHTLKGARLRIGTFQVYDDALAPEFITAIAAAPQSAKGTAEWVHVPKSRGSVLGTNDINRLSLVAGGATAVNSAVALEQRAQMVVGIHPSSAGFVEAAFRNLDNRDWALLNMNDPGTNPFVLQGQHSEPTTALTDPAQVLVAQGGFDKLLQWLRECCDELETADDFADPMEVTNIASTIADILKLIAFCASITDFATLRSREQYHKLVSTLHPHLAALLTSLDFRGAVYMMCATSVVPGHVLGGSSHSDAVFNSHHLLTNLAVAEGFLFNYELLSRISDDAVRWGINSAGLLLGSDSPFAHYNSVMMSKAGFVPSLLYGLARFPAGHHVVVSAAELLEKFLAASAYDPVVISDVLTFCLLTVPLHGDEETVRSKLGVNIVGCMPYIVHLRNYTLRALCNSCGNSKFIEHCAGVFPHYWLPVMTDRFSDPVSVALSLHIGVTMMQQSPFVRKQAERHGTIRATMNSLHLHSHQRDVLTIMLHASIGYNFDPLAGHEDGTLLMPDISPTEVSIPTMMVAFMHLLKSCVVGAQEGNTSQTYWRQPSVCTNTYFASPTTTPVPRSRWRKAVVAVRAIYRMRTLKKVPLDTVFVPLKDSLMHMPSEEERTTRLQLAVQFLELLSKDLMQFEVVSVALFSSSAIDSASWILLCCMPQDIVGAEIASPTRREYGLVDLDDESEDENGEIISSSTKFRAHSWSLDDMSQPVDSDLYRATQKFYSAFCEKAATSFTSVSVSAHNIRTTHFATIIHHILTTVPQGVGDATTDWFHAQVMCIFLRSTFRLQSRTPLATEAGTVVAKNSLSLAQYCMDRFVSGNPAPAAAIADFVVNIMNMFHRTLNSEYKQLRSMMYDWAIYLMSPQHHGWAVARMEGVCDALFKHRVCLVGTQSPSPEYLKVFMTKMVELSLGTLNDYDSTRCEKAQNLAEVWKMLFVSNHSSPVFVQVLTDTASGKNLLNGGFDMLYLKLGAIDMFLSWFTDKRYEIKDAFQNKGSKLKHKNIVCHARRYDRWFSKSRDDHMQDVIKTDNRTEEAVHTSFSSWEKTNTTATIVDSVFLRLQKDEDASMSVVIHEDALSNLPDTARMCFAGGCSVRRECNEHVSINPLRGVNLAAYMHTYGASANPVCAPDLEHPSGQLKAPLQVNANRLLRVLLDDECSGATNLHWIGNVYLMVGFETVICTMMITQSECVLVSSSQVTETGDFFIAQQKPHEAASQSQQQNAIAGAIRRFLPRSSAQAILTSSSQASFRHSQYYRQLRADALIGTDTCTVWRFPLARVTDIHQRRFQHQSAALEFELDANDSVFIVILDMQLTMSKAERQKVVNVLEDVLYQVPVSTTSTKKSVVHIAQKKWMKRQLSTFEYLKALNDCASRTRADLTQYPVFPWVLSDYKSSDLDLQSPAVYRDMSKPVGAMDPKRAEELVMRFNEWIDDTQPPFHHGTHYSMGAVVLYYMVRLMPYTAMSIKYQGGRLDVADRLFHSVDEAWCSSCGPGSDVKELTPEFFTTMSMFSNVNSVELGAKRDGTVLDNVVLPPWCRNSPEKFLLLNRAALESDTISSTIHHWIDLIFGCKQQGDEAVEAVNVFHHLSYDEGLDRAINAASSEEERKAIVASVDNFGLTPKNIVKGAHPKRGPSLAPPKQQLFLSAASHMIRRSVSAQHAVSNRSCSRITSLIEMDSTIYCSTRTHGFTGSRPLQYCVLHDHLGTLAIAVPKEHSTVTVVPSVQSYGHGKVSCFAISPRGTTLACGTREGVVFVFNRISHLHKFSLSKVVFCASKSRVRFLKFIADGLLAVACDSSHLLSVWRVTTSACDLCFTTALEDKEAGLEVPVDNTPIRDVCRCPEDGSIFAVRESSIFVLSSRGVITTCANLQRTSFTLGSRERSVSLSPGGQPQLQAQALTALQEPMYSVAYFAFQGFCTSNVLVCGHGDGSVTVWAVNACLDTTTDRVFDLEFHTAVASGRNSAVTALLTQPDSFSLVTGHADGSISGLSLPQQSGTDMASALESAP